MASVAMPRLRIENPRSLRQELAATLSQAICLALIPPGQHLVEAEMAENMGVGRVPVREAISQLERQGLVTIVPNKGARSIDPSWEECLDALALRVNLETLAARLAAARQDDEHLRQMDDILHQFARLCQDQEVDGQVIWERWRRAECTLHKHLIAASGSKTLVQMWDIVGPFLWATIEYGRRKKGDEPILPHDERERTQQQIERHRQLLAAIRSADMDTAEAAMRTHHQDLFLDADMDPRVLQALRWPTGR